MPVMKPAPPQMGQDALLARLGTAWLAMDCKPIVADCGPADAP